MSVNGKKIIIGLIVLVAVTYFTLNHYIQQTVGTNAETIFKIGGCVKDEEMGITNKIISPAKGSLGAEIILNEKYPFSDQYKVGNSLRLPLNENPQKLYAVQCPM